MSTKEEIFNYVMNSPENTNPAVLKSMLDGIEEGGGGEIPLTAFHATVTTTDAIDFDLGFSSPLLYFKDGNLMYYVGGVGIQDIKYICPGFESRSSQYVCPVFIMAPTDKYIVTLNNESISYDTINNGYSCIVESETYPTEFNLTIADK